MDNRSYDLGYGHLGNGLSVWDRNQSQDGGYKTVAHISEAGEVTFYTDLPQDIRDQINLHAKGEA
jgi:hypothetical protein